MPYQKDELSLFIDLQGHARDLLSLLLRNVSIFKVLGYMLFCLSKNVQAYKKFCKN